MAADPELSTLTLSGDPIVEEASRRFKRCAEWEATCRENFLNDYKFAHGDSDNGYQWPNRIRNNRDVDARPCLTMNVVRQHNLQIVNEAKQNKSSVTFRPVGGPATKDSADLYEAMFRRVEYLSNAQAAYETALEYQVAGGWGWIRLVTEYEGPDTFNQDFRIKRVWDPLSVYMDMDCQEKDCSDARYAFVFDLVPDDELEEAYPGLKELMTLAPLGSATTEDSWNIKDHTRVCEYFRKVPKKDELVSFISPQTGKRVELRKRLMPKEVYEVVKDLPLTKRRPVQDWEVQWFLIVGQQVVDRTIWPGRYIPLVRVLGEETIIEGVLDRKGHTRMMKDPQRMYNYNAPLALSTPVPTPIGWTTIGEIRDGDEVLNEFGQPVRVLGTSPTFLNRDCYKVHFSNGTEIVADADHLWTVEERGKRKTNTYEWRTKTIKTSEFVVGKHFICSTEPLKLPVDKELPIHPYALGVWLGDGDSATARITAHLDDIEEQRALIESVGYSTGETLRYSNAKAGSFNINGIRHTLYRNNLKNDKHIPQSYLRASEEQRWALLQGLMDTDGHITPTHQCVFVNTNKELVSGFIELVRTLGINPQLQRIEPAIRNFPNGRAYTCSASYRVSFSVDWTNQIFRLTRKRVLQQEKRETHWRRTKRVAFEGMEKVESVPVRCIGVDSETHLFLVGWGMVPTHNSAQVEFVALQGKTPWIAAAQAIEEYESMWNTANVVNHSVLVYNGIDDQGNQIEAPQRTPPVQGAPAYDSGMETAFNQMMMTSGQWQNQMGMQGNERTGAAIERRQEQGYTAVFHFQNNYAEALRYIGKQFLDLVPTLYDTKRLMMLQAQDGQDFQLEVDPTAQQMLQQETNKAGEVVRRVLNPKLGQHDVQAEVGPAYGTRREETVRAMTLLLTQNPNLTAIIGDLLLSAMDFKEAGEAAQRLKRMVPPQALGQGPSEAEQQLQQQVKALSDALAKSLQNEGVSKIKLASKDELRDVEVYRAETERLKVLITHMADAGQLSLLQAQLVQEALDNHLDRQVVDKNQDGTAAS